jgi:hypothetical protein
LVFLSALVASLPMQARAQNQPLPPPQRQQLWPPPPPPPEPAPPPSPAQGTEPAGPPAPPAPAPPPPAAYDPVPPYRAAPIDPWNDVGSPQGAPAPAAGPGGVYVELRTNTPGVRIDRVVDGVAFPVCFAPCRQVLPRNNVYVIDGVGIRATSQFMLPDDRQQVTLDLQAGSSATRGLGIALLVGGVVTLYGGLLLSASTNTYDPSTGTTTPSNSSRGAAVLGIGLAAAAIGFFLTLNSHSTVVSSTGVTFSRADPPSARKRPAVALTARGLEF